MEVQTTPRVAIVGGGASGAAVATHLAVAFDPARDLRVDVFDAGGTLGRGIAYSTTDDQHLLNVPAKGMSLFRGDMAHFQRWAGVEPDTFVARARYGDYVQSSLRDAWRKRCGRLRHVRHEVVDIVDAPVRGEGRWELVDNDGGRHRADVVILATGHLPPSAPVGIDPDVVAAEGFHCDPWALQSLADVRSGERILCLGTGLTFVDVSLSALAADPEVHVTGLSRRGRLPSRHLPELSTPLPPMVLPRTGAIDIEQAIEHILSAGDDWRGAIDGMRGQTPEIWQRLSQEDREFYMRHLSRDWDVLRHRMAPAVAARVREHRDSGRLDVWSAPEYRIERLGGRFAVVSGATVAQFDRVVVCTGPRSDVRLTALGRKIVGRGLGRPGPFDIGYDVEPVTGELMTVYGTVVDDIFTVGPLRRGVLFESTAMPEISQQAEQIATEVARRHVLETVA